MLLNKKRLLTGEKEEENRLSTVLAGLAKLGPARILAVGGPEFLGAAVGVPELGAWPLDG